jgi:hypothetical protein
MRLVLAGGLLLTSVAPCSGAERGWSVYTNSANTRRLVVGRRWAAAATSGGLRVIDRLHAPERKWTMNDALPSNDVADVAFDARREDRLWVLCARAVPAPTGARSNGAHWELVLLTLDLGSQQLREEAVAPPGPLPWRPDTRFRRVEEGRVLVGGDSPRAASAWDVEARTWTAAPVPGNAPAEEVLPVGARSGMSALFVRPRQLIWLNGGGVVFYDRARRAASLRPYLADAQLGPPFGARLDGRGVRYQRVKQPWDAQGRVTSALLVTFLQESEGPPRAVARRRLDERQMRRLERPPAAPDLLRGARLVDLVDEGDLLWFATENLPGSRGTGIARYRVGTRSWDYPRAAEEIAANQIIALSDRGAASVAAATMHGRSVFHPRHGGWVPLGAARGSDTSWPFSPTPVRQVARGGVIERVLAEDRSGVRWLQQLIPSPSPGGPARYALQRVDPGRRESLSFADRGALEHLSVYAAAVQGSSLWAIGQDTRRPAGEAAPTVVRWEQDRDRFTVYGGAAIQEAAEASRRSTGTYEGSAGFVQSGGRLWLWIGHALLGFDPARDEWRTETRGVWALHPYPDELWLRSIDPRNTGDEAAQQFFRWRPDEGWQRLEMETRFRPFLGPLFCRTGADYWFGNIGVLRLGRAAARFTADSPLRIGAPAATGPVVSQLPRLPMMRRQRTGPP